MMDTHHTASRGRVARGLASLAAIAVFLSGCMGQAGAHRLGFIPVAALIGNEDGKTQLPADPDLYVDFDDGQGGLVRTPLIRMGFWTPYNSKNLGWQRRLQDPSKTANLAESFMIVDVSNLYQYTALGLEDSQKEDFQRRLRKIAEQLLIAADQNGDIYWRKLVADLESVQLYENLSKLFIGGGAGATFASPTIGVILTVTGLGIEIFRESYVDGLEVDEYASLRESAALYRQAIRGKMYEIIDEAQPGRHAVQSVLRYAQDYAFTYSIKGSLYAVQKQNEELQNLLVTGESSWKPFFEAQRRNYQDSRNEDLEQMQERLQREIALIQTAIERGRLGADEQQPSGGDSGDGASTGPGSEEAGTESGGADAPTAGQPEESTTGQARAPGQQPTPATSGQSSGSAGGPADPTNQPV